MKKKLEFASTVDVETLQPEVDELLQHFAVRMKEPEDTVEDWLSYVFVSDESSLGDFLSFDEEIETLRTSLDMPFLRMRDSICGVARLLRSRRQREQIVQ